jgi:hypothetical protein
MTRKHFKAAAESISKISDPDTQRQECEKQGEAFAAGNPRFDWLRFYSACGVAITWNPGERFP